jgi:aminopeptidase N
MQSETRTFLLKAGYYISVISFIMILTGCGLNSNGDQPPDNAQPGLENAEVNNLNPDETTSALDACDIKAQETAMSPDMKPDWTSLPLSACYQLRLNLHEDLTQYDGKATVTYTNQTGETLTDLVFRLYPNSERIYGGTLEVTSANIDGTLVVPEVFLSDKTGLRLSMVEPINSGETVVIELEFNGELTDGLENSPGTYGIFNFAKEEELVTMANWYPILAVRKNGQWLAEPVVGVGDAVVSEVSLYLVEITAPQNMQIATTGSIIQDLSIDSGEAHRFASGPAREFTITASSNFVLTQAEVNGVQVNQWGLSGGEQRWEEGLQAAVDSLAVFNDLFGPFPYAEMDVVSVPLQLASGVEYPGLFLMKDGLYFLDKEQPYLLTTIISHEVAHQWWYALVGNDVIEHPWQDEALTTFSSLLYLEQFQPRVYDGTVEYFRKVADEIESIRSNTGIGQPVSSFKSQPAQYSSVVYSKGAMFFVELRNKIGDQAFFQALQAYFSQNQYQLASPGSLLSEFEKACQCDLSDFYLQWGLKNK